MHAWFALSHDMFKAHYGKLECYDESQERAKIKECSSLECDSKITPGFQDHFKRPRHISCTVVTQIVIEYVLRSWVKKMTPSPMKQSPETQDMYAVLSCFNCVQFYVTLWTLDEKILLPWGSTVKNIGMGCWVLWASPQFRDQTHVSYVSCIGRQAP